MNSIEDLRQEVEEIKKRNKRVEADKAWETSATRKAALFVLTYLVVTIFFIAMQIKKPFVNAITPTIGFIISTLTLPQIKKWWIEKNKYLG